AGACSGGTVSAQAGGAAGVSVGGSVGGVRRVQRAHRARRRFRQPRASFTSSSGCSSIGGQYERRPRHVACRSLSMDAPKPAVLKGQAPPMLSRDAFGERFRRAFHDPAFEAQQDAIRRIEVIAWEAYSQERKSPRTRKAGPEFADPDYELSDEWLATRDRLRQAAARQQDPATRSRVLVVCGSPRNDGT